LGNGSMERLRSRLWIIKNTPTAEENWLTFLDYPVAVVRCGSCPW
jgi:hypothetical protein